MKRVVVLISGNGSNLASIITHATEIGVEITLVVSNVAGAYGLVRAMDAGIPTALIESKGKTREEFEQLLMQTIDNTQPDVIVLAGFMRILTHTFVDKYAGKMLNIHPSLLPKFKGLHTHKRALDAGESTHGATVHMVSSELDSGEIILQDSLDILPTDTPESLASRVLILEHKLYPAAIRLFLERS